MPLSLLPGYQVILYSDLDGTFLDHQTYSCADSLDALHMLTDHGAPIVFCSSKTRAEIEALLEKLPLMNPFIVENGAAIFIPLDFFPLTVSEAKTYGRYHIIQLGVPYDQIICRFRNLKELFPNTLKGFSDMTAKEVSLDAGLSIDAAALAKQRDFSEVFKFIHHDSDIHRRVTEKIIQYGLACAKGGRYFHMHGLHDKGAAVKILNRLFEKQYGRIRTVAIGDSVNDLPLLAAVDHPSLVKKTGGYHDPEIIHRLPHVHLVDGVGPLGWATAAREIAAGLLKM
jgi:mannosyl-3-phosphoglycerate phosphatase